MTNSDPTREEVLASIVPKSDQLNADDLLVGPITVTITKVSRGDKDQPIVVSIEGRQPYKPCKSMRRVMIAVFTEDPAQWTGQQMTLFCDTDVMWAGVKVGGIRISHMSGLKNPRTFMLTKTRGKRSEVTIRPLAAQPDKPTDAPPVVSVEEQAYIDGAIEQIEKAASLDVLDEIGAVLRSASKAAQAALRGVYRARKDELEKE